jgi:hypothetical protein
VGIDLRVSVSGKVLERREEAVGLGLVDECGGHAPYEFGVFPVGSDVDDRVVRVRVDVENGTERDVHTHCARLETEDSSQLKGKIL